MVGFREKDFNPDFRYRRNRVTRPFSPPPLPPRFRPAPEDRPRFSETSAGGDHVAYTRGNRFATLDAGRGEPAATHGIVMDIPMRPAWGARPRIRTTARDSSDAAGGVLFSMGRTMNLGEIGP